MDQIPRLISRQITQVLATQRIVIIIGQRQIGKTFELRRQQLANLQSLYFDFEDQANVTNWSTVSVANIQKNLGSPSQSRLVLLDEIQKLPRSGSILKLIHDHFPATQVLATGSASYLLLKNIGDSLHGRKRLLSMYPLTFREMVFDASNRQFQIGQYQNLANRASIEALTPQILLYGSLPKIFQEVDTSQKIIQLQEHVSSLLFKDIFEIEGIRSPDVFKKLLTLLALQIGQLVNPNELAQQLNVDRKTVLEYIDIYEKFNIIYRLLPFSGNPRSEITKKFKVYFQDLGIRNAVINNFVDIDFRTDKGGLFENLVINNFKMNLAYFQMSHQPFYWQDYNQFEVDLVLQDGHTGKFYPMEIKYDKQAGVTKSFLNTYQDQIARSLSINRYNFWEMI